MRYNYEDRFKYFHLLLFKSFIPTFNLFILFHIVLTIQILNYLFVFFTVMPDVLTVRVLAEPVLKYNTAVLRCQVPQSAASYTTIVSWTRGDAHLYPSPRGGK